MFSCIFRFVYSILYGTLVHIADFYTAENWWWKYEWTAQNGNKFTYRVEVKEGESVDLQALFKEIHPNGTYQGWYKIFGDEGSKVTNDTAYTPDGNEETLYGKFGYVITFMNEGQVFQTLYTTTGAKGNQLANLGSNPGPLGTYTFRGWTTGQNGTGNAVTTSYQFSGNTTVYAKWVSVISWNYNGTGGTDGSGGGSGSVDVIKGQSWNLPWAGNSSYTWRGWFRDAGFAYWAGDQNGVITPTGNASVFAKWVSIVNFEGAGVTPMGGTPGRRETVEVLKGQSIYSGNAGYLKINNKQYHWRLISGVGPGSVNSNTYFTPTGNATYNAY